MVSKVVFTARPEDRARELPLLLPGGRRAGGVENGVGDALLIMSRKTRAIQRGERVARTEHDS